MTKNDIRNAYFEWIYNLVNRSNGKRSLSLIHIFVHITMNNLNKGLPFMLSCCSAAGVVITTVFAEMCIRDRVKRNILEMQVQYKHLLFLFA